MRRIIVELDEGNLNYDDIEGVVETFRYGVDQIVQDLTASHPHLTSLITVKTEKVFT